jgi:quinol monooxygenase YgiN
MVVEYIRYKVPMEALDSFLIGMAHTVKQLNTASSCLGYELTRSVDDPETYVLRIEWVKDSHKQRFKPSAFIPDIIDGGRPFAAYITDSHFFKPTGIYKRMPERQWERVHAHGHPIGG